MQPLSGLDAFFLYAETETMHMHIALSAVLDPSSMKGGYSFGRISEHIRERLHLVPPFTKKLVTPPMNLHHPYWVEDPQFRLINHLRHVSLPQPGGPEDLGRMVGEIASIPLDRRHPLWEMWIIEGLEDGNIGLLAKIHHACIDGVAGVELLTNFFDLDAEAPPVQPPESAPTGQAPNDAEMLRDAARKRVQVGSRIGPLAWRTVSGLDTVRRLRRLTDLEAGGTPLQAPRLHFNRRLTPNRNMAFAHISLDEVRAVKEAANCKVNDVLLATCTGALRRYLDAQGDLPDRPLVISVPASVRTDAERSQQNNRVSFLISRLHTEIADPLEQLRAAQRAADGAKRENRLIGPAALSEWADVMDPTLFHAGAQLYMRSGFADRHPPIQNLMVSSIPGPDFPVYLAGAELVRAYPMGPILEGAGLNITAMSYLDHVDFGFLACDDLMPGVWDLADQIEPAFAALVEATGARSLLDEPAGDPAPPTPARGT